MNYARLEKVDLLGLLVSKDDTLLIKKLAKLMQEMDYATSMREDAHEILKRTKMDGQQVILRLNNLESFAAILRDEIRRIRKDVKEEMQECM